MSFRSSEQLSFTDTCCQTGVATGSDRITLKAVPVIIVEGMHEQIIQWLCAARSIARVLDGRGAWTGNVISV